MRRIARLALAVCATFAQAACTTVTNPQAGAGETVVVSGTPSPLHVLLDLQDSSARSFTRVLVIAPPQTRECSAGFWAGPLRRGVPDANRQVLLDFEESDSVRVRCSTEQGAVEREFQRVELSRRTYGVDRSVEVVDARFPPMIHVGELDGEAANRWMALYRDLCVDAATNDELRAICRPEAFAALRRADIGE